MGRVSEGPSCPGCGLANYEALCPHYRGDQGAYEYELVPPFESSLPLCGAYQGDGSIPGAVCVLPIGHDGPHFG
jgi:hypothetical protein